MSSRAISRVVTHSVEVAPKNPPVDAPRQEVTSDVLMSLSPGARGFPGSKPIPRRAQGVAKIHTATAMSHWMHRTKDYEAPSFDRDAFDVALKTGLWVEPGGPTHTYFFVPQEVRRSPLWLSCNMFLDSTFHFAEPPDVLFDARKTWPVRPGLSGVAWSYLTSSAIDDGVMDQAVRNLGQGGYLVCVGGEVSAQAAIDAGLGLVAYHRKIGFTYSPRNNRVHVPVGEFIFCKALP